MSNVKIFQSYGSRLLVRGALHSSLVVRLSILKVWRPLPRLDDFVLRIVRLLLSAARATRPMIYCTHWCLPRPA